jgi:hypothetical protein
MLRQHARQLCPGLQDSLLQQDSLYGVVIFTVYTVSVFVCSQVWAFEKVLARVLTF